MDNNRMIEKNRKVFDSFPYTPYLGQIPDYGQRRNKTVRKILRFITVAAAVMSVPLAVYTAIDVFTVKENPSVASVGMVQRTYMVNNGVKGKVQLPDSTIVCLNSGSTLEVSDDFQNERRVTLSGEGYFEVKADRKHPFYISTPKGVEIKVTGTEFNLCCYEEQSDVKLSLVSGSVEVLKGEDTLYKMSEKEDISISGNHIVKASVPKVEDAAAWTEGKLIFDDTPMKDVLFRLERWYGVEIQVEDIRIYNSSFTGEFSSESIVQILELLSITSDIDYHLNGNKVSLNL